MSALTVWAYNVKFGDAILIRVPDVDPESGRETARHILIDVGNVQAGEGGDDAVFAPIVRDMLRRLRGRPIDLYVMTHEHLDHVQGLHYAQLREGLALSVDYAWLPASADPRYYDRHPAARKQLDAVQSYVMEAEKHLAAAPPGLRAMIANNHPRRTSACVDYLRGLAAKKTTYVHRTRRLRPGVHHPFKEATFRILAPEEDTSSYYGRFRPSPLAAVVGASADGGHRGRALPGIQAPDGVDATAFARLLETWRSGVATNIMTIDKAANNTSLVFELQWRGYRLLFPGDAEQRSWLTMQKLLAPVHFLKVSHHGSQNATPPEAILERLFPEVRADRRQRIAALSTCNDTYPGVPDDATVDRLRRRCDLVVSTADVAPGTAVEVTFRAPRSRNP